MNVNAKDFEYDGKLLSEFGMVVCEFDSSGGTRMSEPGSVITFNRVSRNNGRHHSLSSAVFNDCYSAVIQVGRDPCQISRDDQTLMELSEAEYRQLARWLNRREFLPFRMIDSDTPDDIWYFDASFNIKKICIGGILYGMELTMETSRPFAYGPEVTASGSSSVVIDDLSDDVGFLYPEVTVNVSAAGNISLTCSYDGAVTIIKNCSAGEVITLSGDSMIISTSLPGHDIANDFNYVFPKIGNGIDSRSNTISVSGPANVTVRYRPIVKEVL